MEERKESPRKQISYSPTREIVLKFLVIGDYGVGKTAIVRRYVEGKFSSNYKITVGADFLLKTLQWNTYNRVSIQLWDIAGHERFNYMTRVYYKYAVGCVIVFDVTRQNTFASVKKWLKDVRDKVVLDDGRDIPVILLANKCDTEDHCIKSNVISKYCREAGISKWFLTSAKENINITCKALMGPMEPVTIWSVLFPMLLCNAGLVGVFMQVKDPKYLPAKVPFAK